MGTRRKGHPDNKPGRPPPPVHFLLGKPSALRSLQGIQSGFGLWAQSFSLNYLLPQHFRWPLPCCWQVSLPSLFQCPQNQQGPCTMAQPPAPASWALAHERLPEQVIPVSSSPASATATPQSTQEYFLVSSSVTHSSTYLCFSVLFKDQSICFISRISP